MFSRETLVHVLAVLAALASMAALQTSGVVTGPAGNGLALALFYGLTLGGAHLYFALRGEDGTVPVPSRWRFLALLGGGFVLAAIGAVAGTESVAGVSLGSVLAVVAGVAVLTYAVVESLAGYRASLEKP